MSKKLANIKGAIAANAIKSYGKKESPAKPNITGSAGSKKDSAQAPVRSSMKGIVEAKNISLTSPQKQGQRLSSVDSTSVRSQLQTNSLIGEQKNNFKEMIKIPFEVEKVTPELENLRKENEQLKAAITEEKILNEKKLKEQEADKKEIVDLKTNLELTKKSFEEDHKKWIEEININKKKLEDTNIINEKILQMKDALVEESKAFNTNLNEILKEKEEQVIEKNEFAQSCIEDIAEKAQENNQTLKSILENKYSLMEERINAQLKNIKLANDTLQEKNLLIKKTANLVEEIKGTNEKLTHDYINKFIQNVDENNASTINSIQEKYISLENKLNIQLTKLKSLYEISQEKNILIQKVNSYEEEIEKLKEELQIAQEGNNVLKLNLKELKMQNENLINNITNEQTKICEQYKEFNANIEEKQKMQLIKIDSALNQITSLESKVQEKQNDYNTKISALNEERNNLNKRCDDLTEANNHLQEENEKEVEERKNFSFQKSKAEYENKGLIKEKENFQKKNASLETLLVEKEEELKNLNIKYEEKMEKNSKDISLLKEKAELDIKLLNEKLQNIENRNKSEVNFMQTEIETKNKEIQLLQNKLNDTLKNIEEIKEIGSKSNEKSQVLDKELERERASSSWKNLVCIIIGVLFLMLLSFNGWQLYQKRFQNRP